MCVCVCVYIIYICEHRALYVWCTHHNLSIAVYGRDTVSAPKKSKKYIYRLELWENYSVWLGWVRLERSKCIIGSDVHSIYGAPSTPLCCKICPSCNIMYHFLCILCMYNVFLDWINDVVREAVTGIQISFPDNDSEEKKKVRLG